MKNKLSFDEFEKIVIEFAERRQYGYGKVMVKNLLVKKITKLELMKRKLFWVMFCPCLTHIRVSTTKFITKQ